MTEKIKFLEVEKVELQSEVNLFKMLLYNQSKISRIIVDFLTDSFEEIASKSFDLSKLARIKKISTDGSLNVLENQIITLKMNEEKVNKDLGCLSIIQTFIELL